MSRIAGTRAEDCARIYLMSQGLRWVTSNFRSYCGEIDLIMRDKKTLVFVEVRARTSSSFGDGVESVTWHKQRKLIKTAEFYLQKMMITHDIVRFDVVSLDGKPPVISWIRDAFTC